VKVTKQAKKTDVFELATVVMGWAMFAGFIVCMVALASTPVAIALILWKAVLK
jgi:hypothetical protein